MSEGVVKGIYDCPQLACCKSSLRSCSKDDSDRGNVTYMFDDPDVEAINFDMVMSNYCNSVRAARNAETLGTARSVDALYVGNNMDVCDETLALVEFKNGNLLERQRSLLSNAEFGGFKEDLTCFVVEFIEKTLTSCMDRNGRIDWDSYGEQTDEHLVKQTVESFCGEWLRSGRRDRGFLEADRRSYRLETIKSKATSSALVLQWVLQVDVGFISDRVDFVLVYNPFCNPGTDSDREILSDNTVPSSPSLNGRFTAMLARHAKRPRERFGLRESLGALFHDVLTCTPEEFSAYVVAPKDRSHAAGAERSDTWEEI